MLAGFHGKFGMQKMSISLHKKSINWRFVQILGTKKKRREHSAFYIIEKKILYQWMGFYLGQIVNIPGIIFTLLTLPMALQITPDL